MAETTTQNKPTIQDQFKARSEQNAATITGAYDSGIAAQKQSLLDAYNANTAAQQGAAETVRQTGGMAANDIGVQNARNTANINQFADVRGVNRQQGSQAALSLGAAQNAAMGDIAYRQQTALAENQRQQDLAKAQYQARVQAAIADKDYKQAAALLDNYNNENAWRDQQAALLASYGNFDPYRTLYGDEAGTAMQKVWSAQNPEVAYRTGAISAEAYKQITGKYPAGYTPPRSGYVGGYGWYDPRGGGGDNNGGDDGEIGAPGRDLGGVKPFTPLNVYSNGRTISRATPYKGSTITSTSGKVGK